MSDTNIQAHIIKLEKELLDFGTRKSSERLNELLAEDFVEFGSSGNIYKKIYILEHLPNESERSFDISNIEVCELGYDHAFITYKIQEKNTASLRSSIWRKNEGDWQIIFHQGTLTSNFN